MVRLSSLLVRIFLLTIILFGVLFVNTSLTLAQQEGSGIGIKPATIEEGLDPGQSENYSMTVKNLSGATQTYYIFTKDINGVQEGGVPTYADDGAEKTGYELSQWVSLDTSEIVLDPDEEKDINITIDVPEFASPGSHFGAVFVSLTPPKLRKTGASVGYQVANIISIRVAGDAVVNAQIRQFSTGNYIYGSSNVDFQAKVENKGTVLVRPVGPLEIHNMFGKRVAVLTFNDSKAAVFPGVTRAFDLTWEDEGPGFGRYQAVLSLVYGDQGRQSTISSTVSFWILPMNIILPSLGVLAFLLLIAYIFVKLYIRSKLQVQAGGARRIRRTGRQRGGGISALLLVTVVMLAVTALFLIVLLALFA
jgi:hypothetical protein